MAGLVPIFKSKQEMEKETAMGKMENKGRFPPFPRHGCGDLYESKKVNVLRLSFECALPRNFTR